MYAIATVGLYKNYIYEIIFTLEKLVYWSILTTIVKKFNGFTFVLIIGKYRGFPNGQECSLLGSDNSLFNLLFSSWTSIDIINNRDIVLVCVLLLLLGLT
jgi:hypothetical protein